MTRTDELTLTDACPLWCADRHLPQDGHLSGSLERLTVELASGEETIVRVQLSQDPGGLPSVVISIGDEWTASSYMGPSEARRLAQGISQAALCLEATTVPA